MVILYFSLFHVIDVVNFATHKGGGLYGLVQNLPQQNGPVLKVILNGLLKSVKQLEERDFNLEHLKVNFLKTVCAPFSLL